MMSDRPSCIWDKALLLGCSLTVSLGIGLVMGGGRAIAQITPDNTMGGERSRVQSGQVRGAPATRIGGGAIRGENLFHSFSEFNVNNGQRVYFNNPAGIENILGRVTGRDVSDINGTLGVAGNANLFLINPNGFIFGPNARLDIRGSFTASTADRFSFGNGQFFSTFNPQTPPLLTLNVPIGLQYNPGRGLASSIENEAILIAGQDLTLHAGFLNLSGQIRAGNNLTLQAQSILQTSSASNQSFLATSGRNMRLQGNGAINISTTQPFAIPQLRSGHNLYLVSNGVITTNARLTSASNLIVQTITGEPGHWVNWQNINVGGTVSLPENYTGASLQVNAAGDINYGTVVINSPNPVFALNAGGRITGTGDVSSSEPGLVVSLNSQGDIDIQRIITRGGSISLLSYDGSITTSNLLSGTLSNSYYVGGNISLSASRDIINRRNLSTLTSNIGSSGDSGRISLYSGGNIIVRSLETRSRSSEGFSGRGGDITLYSRGNIEAHFLDTASSGYGSNDDSGDIAMRARGNIRTINSSSFSSSRGGNRGYAGNIIFNAGRDIVAENSIAAAESDSIGEPDFTTILNGGSIIFDAARNITATNTDTHSYSNGGFGGIGGNIIFSAGGDIEAVETNSSSQAVSGNITFSVGRNIITGDLNAYSYNFENSGVGGQITLTAENNIYINGSLNSFSYAFNNASYNSSNNAGTISLVSINGSIIGSTGGSINSFSIANGDEISPARGGNVILQTRENVTDLDIFTFSNSAPSGDVYIFGAGSLLMSNVRMLTSQQLQVEVPFGEFGTRTENISIQDEGQSGQVYIRSAGHLSVLESYVESTTRSNNPAGNISLQSPERITINNSNIVSSNTNGSGAAGNIVIETPYLSLYNSQLISETLSGSRGNIQLQGLNWLEMQDNSLISAAARESAGGGNISINTPETLGGFILGFDNSDIIATADEGSGGEINIYADGIFNFIARTEPDRNILRSNSTNDISASSRLGTQGTVNIQADVDPTRSTVELPSDVVDASRLVGQQCQPDSNTTQVRSEFYVSGSGGQSSSPTDALDTNLVLDDLGNNPSSVQVETEPAINPEVAIASTSPHEIVEAQGWRTDADGTVVLTANATTTTSHGGWRSPLTCATATSSQ